MGKLLAKFKPSSAHRLITAFLVLGFIGLPGHRAVAADFPVTNSEIEESAAESSNRITERVDSFNQQIDSLETEFGPFDRSLLEPLQSLTGLFIEAGNFEAADRLLKRRLQLYRVADGLESPSQFPALAELIRNDIQRSQWQEVTANFETIYRLQTQNPEADPATVLEALNAIGAWHFAAIYLDDPRRRASHFQDAREIQRQLLGLAEVEFGEESAALIPWLYQDALERFRLVAFYRSEDELGHKTNIWSKP